MQTNIGAQKQINGCWLQGQREGRATKRLNESFEGSLNV